MESNEINAEILEKLNDIEKKLTSVDKKLNLIIGAKSTDGEFAAQMKLYVATMEDSSQNIGTPGCLCFD